MAKLRVLLQCLRVLASRSIDHTSISFETEISSIIAAIQVDSTRE